MITNREYYLDVSVNDGKYRFIKINANSPIQVLRYNGPWIEALGLHNVPGGKALTAALFELEALKKERVKDES